MSQRTLAPRMLVTLLALLGLLDAAYLTVTRYVGSIALACPVGGGCEAVQTSRWSTIPPGAGVSIAVIGIIGYTLLLLLGLTMLQRDYIGAVALPTLLVFLAGGGVLFAIYLTALQLFVIHAICFWCVVSALIELSIFVAALIDWRQWRITKPTDIPVDSVVSYNRH